MHGAVSVFRARLKRSLRNHSMAGHKHPSASNATAKAALTEIRAREGAFGWLWQRSQKKFRNKVMLSPLLDRIEQARPSRAIPSKPRSSRHIEHTVFLRFHPPFRSMPNFRMFDLTCIVTGCGGGSCR